MQTDNAVSFDADNLRDRSVIDMVGFPMAQACAQEVYVKDSGKRGKRGERGKERERGGKRGKEGRKGW